VLRRTKIYKKDYKTETPPWDEIEREILGLAKHSGDIEVSIESTFSI